MEKELIYEQVKVLRDKFDMFNSINFLLLLFGVVLGVLLLPLTFCFAYFFHRIASWRNSYIPENGVYEDSNLPTEKDVKVWQKVLSATQIMTLYLCLCISCLAVLDIMFIVEIGNFFENLFIK